MCCLKQEIETDILVVGLGPAGARAAFAAANMGRTVIAIDRKKVAGLPVQCAEFIPSLIDQEAGAVNVCQKITKMMTFVEDDPPDLKTHFSGQMINRADFDQSLVREAVNAGASCIFDTLIQSITRSGVVILASGEKIYANVIIGADGPRSIVGKSIGSINSALVHAHQVTVPLKETNLATDIFLSASTPGGYGWLFPKGEVANLGVGVNATHRFCLKTAMHELRTLMINEDRIGNRILCSTGGYIPVGGALKPYGKIGDRLLLLAGDAAGLTNPVTGAGINAAVQSGRLAGERAVTWLNGNNAAATEYEEELLDRFGSSLARALKHRSKLMKIYNNGYLPTKQDLRHGWIAYPEYWMAISRIQDQKPIETFV